jgi:hypothetical protein
LIYADARHSKGLSNKLDGLFLLKTLSFLLETCDLGKNVLRVQCSLNRIASSFDQKKKKPLGKKDAPRSGEGRT